jgi:hypothetical protein
MRHGPLRRAVIQAAICVNVAAAETPAQVVGVFVLAVVWFWLVELERQEQP